MFALEAHEDQKYGERPYFYHLEKVAALAERFATQEMREHALMVAWLHDVLEDTDVTNTALVAAFGPKIARAVQELSGTPGESKEAEFARLTKASPLAKFVKACDLTANMTACVQDLHVEYLQGYAGNLARYEVALGDALSGVLLSLCRTAAQASHLGISKQVTHEAKHAADLGYVVYFTKGFQVSNLAVRIHDGLVELDTGPGISPVKSFER